MTGESTSGEFAGLTAVVTGGASGIGAAVASALLAAGADVAILDRTITDAPPGAAAYESDVTDDDSVRAAIALVVARFGGIDILVNNAGIGAQGTVEDNTDDEWRKVFDVNLMGAVRLTRATLPHLRRSRSAAVVNVCSVAATVGLPQRALYSASKGAVLALTKAMATDHLHEGIRVNCVSPGTADTPWVKRLLDSAADPEHEYTALRARQPHGRLVTADEVAQAVCYLASPLNGSTTGTELVVDGGLRSLRPRPRA